MRTEGKTELTQEKINSVMEFFSNGNYEKALKTLSFLIETYPNNSLLFNIKGACYAGLGQLENAVKSYKKAVLINPKYSKAHYNLGGAFHELGALDDSVKSYLKSLSIDPDYAEAHNNLGNVYRQKKLLDKAVNSYTSAININPDYLEAHYSIGLVFQDLGQTDLMISHIKKVITIKPDFAEAHNNLGIALKRNGKLDDAILSYKNAIAIQPNNIKAYNNLGNVFKEKGLIDQSIRSYKAALQINPNLMLLNINLGNAYKELGQLDDAISSYEKAISIDSNNSEAYNNLGIVLNKIGRTDNAITSYEKALEINPKYTDSYNNLGIVLKKIGRLDDAITSYQEAIKINPNNADTHNNLGIAFADIGRLEDAIESYEKALSINTEYAESYNNLGIVFLKLKKLDKALKYNQKALILKPKFAEGLAAQGRIYTEQKQLYMALASLEKVNVINSNLAYNLGAILNVKMNLCHWEDLPKLLVELNKKINDNKEVIVPFDLLGLVDDPRLQFKASEIYAREQFPKNFSLPSINAYKNHKKIRIGYFSADFKLHPVATLTAELYEIHDRKSFEIYAFSFGPNTNDEMNLRIKAGVDHFYDVREKSDKEVVLLARSLEIDIAIDLSGYTADSRTSIFAMSAAPIQASYIGVLSTMGAKYYDYLIAGKSMIPKENQKYFTEKIVYLPSYQVNDSKEPLPELSYTRDDFHLPTNFFIFCCFNSAFKLNPSIFDSWARILKAVNKSVLFLAIDEEEIRLNLINEISQRGIDYKRLIFGDRIPRPEYLARYKVADLFLDTRPYNAGTTASDALRMGLPVLTLKGQSFNSREASSVLTSLNMQELITTSEAEYESLAIELASNPTKLKFIKDRLMENLSSAPLYNTPLFTKNLETAYKKMFIRSQKGLQPDHIYVD
ncbi:MAG: tetratricopeptide repeat protein [Candidatus Pseudothioglobus sp.]